MAVRSVVTEFCALDGVRQVRASLQKLGVDTAEDISWYGMTNYFACKRRVLACPLSKLFGLGSSWNIWLTIAGHFEMDSITTFVHAQIDCASHYVSPLPVAAYHVQKNSLQSNFIDQSITSIDFCLIGDTFSDTASFRYVIFRLLKLSLRVSWVAVHAKVYAGRIDRARQPRATRDCVL